MVHGAKVFQFSGHISDNLSVVAVKAEPHKGYLVWSSEWPAPLKGSPRYYVTFKSLTCGKSQQSGTKKNQEEKTFFYLSKKPRKLNLLAIAATSHRIIDRWIDWFFSAAADAISTVGSSTQ